MRQLFFYLLIIILIQKALGEIIDQRIMEKGGKEKQSQESIANQISSQEPQENGTDELNSLDLQKFKQKSIQFKKKRKSRVKSEHWEYKEIQKIFTLYAHYGSQWRNMEPEFHERSANSIKNRFYTVIRTFIKLLFRYHPKIIHKLPHQIASKTILKFYEAREQFEHFRRLGKKILRKINYNLNSKHLKNIVLQNLDLIQQLYEQIFHCKIESQGPSKQEKRQKRLKNKRERKHLNQRNPLQIQKFQDQSFPNNENNPNLTLNDIAIHKNEANLTVITKQDPIPQENNMLVLVPFSGYYCINLTNWQYQMFQSF